MVDLVIEDLCQDFKINTPTHPPAIWELSFEEEHTGIAISPTLKPEAVLVTIIFPK